MQAALAMPLAAEGALAPAADAHRPEPGADGTSLGERVAAVAMAEWVRWGRLDVERSAAGRACLPLGPGRCEPVDDGCGREQSARWCPLVNDYWAQAFIGAGRWFFHDCSRVDVCALRWPGGEPPIRTPAWSAAFVGAVMHAAGLDDGQFPRTPYHVDYVRAAIDGPRSAYRVDPVPAPVAPGSLVCALRGAVQAVVPPIPGQADPERADPAQADPTQVVPDQVDPALATTLARIGALRGSDDPAGPTPMHCDIVVEADAAAGRALAIGGNVMQSVSRLAYPLDPAGRVTAVAGAVASPLLVLTPRPDPDPSFLPPDFRALRPSTSPLSGRPPAPRAADHASR